LSTYPDGGNTAQEALDLVAKTAYDALIEKNRKRPPQLTATTNSSEALQRLLKVLINCASRSTFYTMAIF
jgi:hypothetical protein